MQKRNTNLTTGKTEKQKSLVQTNTSAVEEERNDTAESDQKTDKNSNIDSLKDEEKAQNENEPAGKEDKVEEEATAISEKQDAQKLEVSDTGIVALDSGGKFQRLVLEKDLRYLTVEEIEKFNEEVASDSNSIGCNDFTAKDKFIPSLETIFINLGVVDVRLVP